MLAFRIAAAGIQMRTCLTNDSEEEYVSRLLNSSSVAKAIGQTLVGTERGAAVSPARCETRRKGHAMAKNTICLWYDKDAEAAARFYAATFPDSAVGAVHRAPSDYPSGKRGDVLTVEFTVAGVPCLGLNGGPVFKHNEAFSFQIATDDQEETDRYWNDIVGNGGQESACG